MSNQSFKSTASEIGANALFLTIVAGIAFVPWLLHFTVSWWAGLISVPAMFFMYDVLFAPKGSLCMGIPFVLPLSSALVLLVFDCLLLVWWVAQAVFVS